MDGHVGDDFPDEYPDDFGDSGTDGSDADGDLPAADLTGVGDAWDDTVDLDGDDPAGDDPAADPAWPADSEHPVGSDAVDFDAEETGTADYSDDVPDAAADAPASDAEDVPVVGDDAPVGLGADPDVPAGDSGDGSWLDLPDLANVDVPEPAGGPPWVDTQLLGDADADSPDVPITGDSVPATPDGGAADLRTALGEPPGVGDPTDGAYQELAASDDPAVRNLARLWGPPS